MSKLIRNVCIIAHVDHGKTTLVDHLLRQSGTFGQHEQVDERVMDSMDLERERGITIAAKNAAISYDDIKINIVDTPGHADFGGEVERIMSMVDGAILLVDAAEGPLPQTRFVLEKALKSGHRVILCINKVDRQEVQGTNRISEVVDQVFDLFIELGASDEQAHFPILYACARKGWCTEDPAQIPDLLEAGESKTGLKRLTELICEHVPPPKLGELDQMQLLVANLAYSEYVGQLAIGRVNSGEIKRGQKATRWYVSEDVETVAEFSVSKLFVYQGMQQVEVDSIEAGDIGLVAGCAEVCIGDTISDSKEVPALPRIDVEKPTLSVIFSVNSSPLSGREGEAIQSRKLYERLQREVRTNVALKLGAAESPDQIIVNGRGELQFAILIEQMRREGFEFMVGRPQVLLIPDESGQTTEPIEIVVCDIPENSSGEITEMFQKRKGVLQGYENLSETRVRLKFEIPTRGLLGIRSRFLTATRGEGLMNSKFLEFQPYKGDIVHRINGSIIADRSGPTVEYALANLDDRGVLFVKPGIEVYEGMIIGEHNRENDINVNPCKEKKLTNVRSVMSDGLTMLQGIREMTLEKCLEWIDDDDWIEVTPESVRLRKKVLQKNQRSVIRNK